MPRRTIACAYRHFATVWMVINSASEIASR